VPVELSAAISIEQAMPTPGEWHELWRRCPAATPFQSTDWLLPWWQHFGNRQPWVLAARCEDRLVGLLPLFIYDRVLALIGSGITDHLDALVLPGFEGLVASAWGAYLEQHTDEWDECDWQELGANSPLLALPVPPRWHDETTRMEACPVLATADCSRQSKVQQYWRRAERVWGARWEPATLATLDGMLEGLCRLHGARWETQQLPGVLREGTVQAFHRDATHALFASGTLRMFAVRAGTGAIVGVTYGMQRDNWACLYLTGFDPAYAKFSVGTMLLGAAIQEAAREGATVVDFLRGREPYKYTWGVTDRWNYRRVLRHGKGKHD